jgi:UDP-N-acetylmuramate--alanine ligase
VKIYCSGIGGIGLSAYASLQKIAGHDVAGSDRNDSALLEDLRSQGIEIVLDQSGAKVPKDADLFVYSEAIPPDAPERKKAAELGIQQISYPQALGELSKNHTVIAVCGTHGKSSTTAMAAKLLMEAGKDPTIVVGTKLRELNGRNWCQGKSDLFLLEACEYKHSFHQYSPDIILLTTCDGDHFDFYASDADYKKAFVDFIQRLPEGGKLVTHMSDDDCRTVAEAAGRRTIDADTFPKIPLLTPGEHMRQNAQLVLGLAQLLGISPTVAAGYVSNYAGSWRRMEERGKYKDIPVIDDYAHHPKEIAATLQALREKHAKSRVVCVFQPHTHDRTIKLFAEFEKSFSDADLVLVTDIYEARKHLDGDKADPKKLAEGIAAKSDTDARYAGSLADVAKLLKTELQSGDVLICMGAGDVTALAGEMATA